VSNSGERIQISVSDNGPGMPPEVLAQAGSLFFTTRPDGAGLGLAQCRRLIGDAGGTFDLKSIVGTGTKATLTLPVHQQQRDATQ
jgi:signal transduction histidine kinase